MAVKDAIRRTETLFEWPRGGERLRIGTGRGSFPGTAAWPCGAGPPESAGVLGAARPRPTRPGVAPAADNKAGPPRPYPAHRYCDPGEKASRRTPSPVAVAILFS